MSRPAIIDTSIYVGHFRQGLYKKGLQELPYLIRHCSVVLAELYRGCRTKEEVELIDELRENCPIFTPTEKSWLESGKILARLSQEKGYLPEKLRDLHFDVLIALVARQTGAVLITADRTDFEEIRRIKNFKLVVW